MDYQTRAVTISHFIVVGCGMAATELERWDKQTVQVIDNVTRPGTVNCLYSASAPDINKCTHKGVGHWLRTAPPDDVEISFWSVQGQNPGSELIPYCPKGWFIDTSNAICAEDKLAMASTYHPECCKACQDQLPGLMKASNYQECPGTTTEDVQTWVASCAAGQYFNATADGTRVCKPCTVCG